MWRRVGGDPRSQLEKLLLATARAAVNESSDAMTDEGDMELAREAPDEAKTTHLSGMSRPPLRKSEANSPMPSGRTRAT